MQKLSLDMSVDDAFDHQRVERSLRERLGMESDDPLFYRLVKRSIDARRHRLKCKLTIQVYHRIEDYQSATPPSLRLQPLSDQAPKVIIVGAGPAGLFAALRAISLGLKPVILERGQSVRVRRKALATLNRTGLVNPESNYCFGEGGAGTYSDGKLYTRSKKRGAVRAILQLLVDHGAPSEILYEAQPHIGTNRLPKVIQAIREKIINCGGEVCFDAKVVDLLCSQVAGKRVLRGVSLADGSERFADVGVILATGHSARDIFELLHHRGVEIEAKPFALGVRVEHPQTLIDHIQYHGERPTHLGSAAYKLVAQADRRGVFSFCMCPGGIIAPAATNPGEVVVNGWSPYKRNGAFANSGIVVSVDQEDFMPFASDSRDPLAGVKYQSDVERRAFISAGASGVTAPAQRLVDFLKRRPSSTLPESSYIPGLSSTSLQEVLPDAVERRLLKGFKHFGERLKGYIHPDAIVVGVESRTSSPVRIPRDRLTLEHPSLSGLFPCGEGAGYAGGIVSAALDGFRCVEATSRGAPSDKDQWSNVLESYREHRGGIGS